MSNYIVTDDGIREFLLVFLNENIKKDRQKDFEPGFLQAIYNFLETFPDKDRLRDKMYSFKDEDRNEILAIINEYYADSDGDVVSVIDAINQMKNFEDDPTQICIDDLIIGTFINDVKLVDLSSFPNHEMAFRFYFGHEKPLVPTPTKRNKYGVVVVPICSPLVAPGVGRDHRLDLEATLFSTFTTQRPFALTISDLAKGISYDTTLWARIAANKDHLSITELTYYSLEQFDNFRNGVNAVDRVKMCLFFARKSKGGSINCIVSFFDSQDIQLSSSFLRSGIKTVGAFFDQGDLIPPPSPVSDKSF